MVPFWQRARFLLDYVATTIDIPCPDSWPQAGSHYRIRADTQRVRRWFARVCSRDGGGPKGRAERWQ
jgi:hypothetical protein